MMHGHAMHSVKQGRPLSPGCPRSGDQPTHPPTHPRLPALHERAHQGQEEEQGGRRALNTHGCVGWVGGRNHVEAVEGARWIVRWANG